MTTSELAFDTSRPREIADLDASSLTFSPPRAMTICLVLCKGSCSIGTFCNKGTPVWVMKVLNSSALRSAETVSKLPLAFLRQMESNSKMCVCSEEVAESLEQCQWTSPCQTPFGKALSHTLEVPALERQEEHDPVKMLKTMELRWSWQSQCNRTMPSPGQCPLPLASSSL